MVQVFKFICVNTGFYTEKSTSGLRCAWQDCRVALDATHNILEHIQTVHVAPQINMDGYICLWEGCKVYNKKSCSLSWLERHVLSHGGNKPFKCIIPGCGLSFGSQGALERHVNSHISNNGISQGTGGPHVGMPRKMDASPSKSAKRKKQKHRKQRQVAGQHTDFFDKHTMEVIKYRLVTSREMVKGDQHDCYFVSEVLNWRYSPNEEPHVLVRWHPFNVFPDEWIPQSKHAKLKVVPFRQIPPSKIKILYPHLFPPERKEKAQRKWKPRSSSSSSSSSSSHSSNSSDSSISSAVSSPTLSVENEGAVSKYEASSPSSANSSLEEDDFNDDSIPDWMHYLVEAYVS